MAECVECQTTCSLTENYVECPHCHTVMCPECAEKHAMAMDTKERKNLQKLREGDALTRMKVLCPSCRHEMILGFSI